MTIELEIKSADAAEVKGGGVIAVDDDRTFTIIGSVTGIRDEVNDIIEPGAYAETLRKRTPKIIKDHSWSDRLGKTLHIEEYLPGDSRLPKTTANGDPWPSEAGALVAKVRLFGSTAGKEAAERWREYGNEQQYSIGYVVPAGKAAKDPKTGIRRIKSLDLFEISDVLWGAMPLAGPMPQALATKMLPALVSDEDTDTADGEAEVKSLDDGADVLDDDVQAALVDVLLNVKESDLDIEALLNYPSSSERKNAVGGRGYAAEPWSPAAASSTGAFAPGSLATGASRTTTAGGSTGTHSLSRSGTSSLLASLRDISGASDAITSSPSPTSPRTASDGTGFNSGASAAQPTTRLSGSEGGAPSSASSGASTSGATRPGGSMGSPLRSTTPSSPTAAGASSAGRTEVGAGDALTSTTATSAAAPAASSATTATPLSGSQAKTLTGYDAWPTTSSSTERKYDTSPVGTPGGRQNWVDKAGGLPDFIRAISHALIRHGATESHAIATAVAACKRWAAGGGKVSAKTRAKAAAAVAEFTRKHTAGKGLMDTIEDTFFGWRPDLDPDAGEKAAPVTLESRGAPRLPGSLEERRDLIAAEVKAHLGSTSTVVGTAEDHVVVSRLVLTDGEPTGVESFSVGYKLRGGLVHLDDPEPVTLSLQTADGAVTSEDIHLLDAVEDATVAAKALLLPGIEGKVGRVLSGGNALAIKNAVVALLRVLQAAGVDIDAEDAADGGRDEATESDAPSAVAVKGLDGLPDPHDLVASLRAAARAE